MIIELVTIVLCFFFFLFTLFLLSKEDFVFLRKNITLDDIFTVAFLTFFLGIFFSRVFYVAEYFTWNFLNPLVFFLIPYFPGLSLLGGVVGGSLSLLVIAKRRKFPRGRLFDFFAYAFLSILPLAYIGNILSGITGPLSLAIVPIIYYTVLFIFFYKVLLPRFLQGQMRDGMMGLLILMNYALFSLAVTSIAAYLNKQSLVQFESALLLLVFVVAVFFYIRQGYVSQLRRNT